MPTSALHRAALWCLLTLLALPARAQTNAAAAGSPRDRAREILALRSAAGQVMEELGARSTTQQLDTVQLTEQLTALMLKDPAAHRRPGDSRNRSRQLAEQQQRLALERALSNAVSAAQARSPLPIRREDVLELVGPSWADEINRSLTLFLSNQFASVFSGARVRAVALQQKTALENLRYPDPGELDIRLLALWQQRQDEAVVLQSGDFDQLGGWIKSLTGRPVGPLFEEVEQQFNEASARRKDELRRQYDLQLGALRARADHVPARAIARSTIAAELRASAEADVAARQIEAREAGSPLPVYPVFQVIQSNAWHLASQIEADRLSSYLRESGQPRVESQRLQEAITREPARHRTRTDSEQIFRASLWPAVRDEVSAAYARKVGAPDPARNEVRDALGGADQTGRAFQEQLNRALSDALQAARAAVAEEQYQAHFGFIPGAEPLSDELLARIQNRNGKPVTTLDELLALLPDHPDVDPAGLLEETTALAVQHFNQALTDGYEALQEQARLVRAVEVDRREELARDVAAERPVDDVLKAWTADFTRRWKTVAATQNSRYEEPLAATRDLLNKTVRQLYDAQKKADAAPTATATPGNPSPAAAAVSPRENQRDEPEDKEDQAEVEQHTLEEVLLVPCDASLVIRDVSPNECEAVLRLGPEAAPVTVRFAPDAAEQAATALFEGLRPALAGLVDEQKAKWKGRRNFLGFHRKETPELRFYMVVRSREIRHQTSLLLRNQISELLQQWSETNHPGQPVTLDWTVGLGAVALPE